VAALAARKTQSQGHHLGPNSRHPRRNGQCGRFSSLLQRWFGRDCDSFDQLVCSFAAYKADGKASKVTTIAGALQPVFTIVLAIAFLSESISWVEFIGIALAIVAALALSYEKQKLPESTHQPISHE
jgi:EamA-like transporter family